MLSSTSAHEYIRLAANMDTEIVLPNLRGVLIRISWLRLFQLLISKIFWNARWNAPCPSALKNTLAHAAMNASWNLHWKKLRFHPARSIASSPARHLAIRVNPLHSGSWLTAPAAAGRWLASSSDCCCLCVAADGAV